MIPALAQILRASRPVPASRYSGLTFLSGTGDLENAVASHIFSSISTGTAISNRVLIAVVMSGNNHGSAHSSFVGSVTGSFSQLCTNVAGTYAASIYAALAPTGTSEDFTLTNADTEDYWHLKLYSVLMSSVVANNTGTGSFVSSLTGGVTLSVPANGFSIIGALGDAGSLIFSTNTGYTSDNTKTVNGSTAYCSHLETVTAVASGTRTVTQSVARSGPIVGASWKGDGT